MKTNTSGRESRLQFSLTAQHLVDPAFIAWSAASPDSSPEFWALPYELCYSWGRRTPPPPHHPTSYYCMFCIPHAETASVLRHQLCLTCLDLLGFPVLIILFGRDGWWLKYSAVKYSWYLSHQHTHTSKFVWHWRLCFSCVLNCLLLPGEGFFSSVVWCNSAILWCLCYCLSLPPQLEWLPAQ